jgi:response regulator RpfG family c-di-GMP phosphodiesterase
MDETKEINVLYVDDEENNLISFRAAFRRDFNIYTALSVDEGNYMLANHEIHVLITDQRMPGKLGTELLAQAVKDNPDQIRILLTGYSDINALKDAVNRGQIFRYIEKPWVEEELRATIQEAYQVYILTSRQKALSTELLEINGKLEFMLRQKLIS